MSQPLVTILDDEPEIRRILADTLEEAGFRTVGFSRATEFEAALKSNTPDVCLVDLGLPDRDGLTLVHRLALEQGAIVIIISGRAQVQDRVTGLELGADDYIIKPFDPSEVVARIRARLRKDRAQAEPGNLAKFADWTADFDRYSLIDSQAKKPHFLMPKAKFYASFLKVPNASFPAHSCKNDWAARRVKALIARWMCVFRACARN